MRWGTIVVLLIAWEIAARFADPSFVASPTRVLRALGPTVLGDPGVVRAIGMTVLELVVAFVLSVAVGAAAGVLIGSSEFRRRALFPFVLLVYGLPQVVLLPLFILVFGLGPASRIAFGFAHGVLPVIVTTVAGMRNVDVRLLAAARSLGASRAQIFRHITLPTMIASVFAGLRLAMAMTLLGVILAELFVSTNGIGNYTQLFAETFKPASLYGLIAVLAAIAVVLNALVGRIETHFSRWKQG